MYVEEVEVESGVLCKPRCIHAILKKAEEGEKLVAAVALPQVPEVGEESQKPEGLQAYEEGEGVIVEEQWVDMRHKRLERV